MEVTGLESFLEFKTLNSVRLPSVFHQILDSQVAESYIHLTNTRGCRECLNLVYSRLTKLHIAPQLVKPSVSPPFQSNPASCIPTPTPTQKSGGRVGRWVWLRCSSPVQTPLHSLSLQGRQGVSRMTVPRCPCPNPSEPGPCDYVWLQGRWDEVQDPEMGRRFWSTQEDPM